MSFRRFEILILLQLILIAATAFISAWAFLQDYLRVSGLYFMGLLILEIIGLYRFLIKQNKNLISFLEGLVHRDEYSKLEESGGRKEIHKLLNQIAKSYSTVKIEKESEHQYLLNTVKHVNIGLTKFVETYLSLTKVPEPKLSRIKVKDLINQITVLKNPELSQKNINITSVVNPQNLSIEADEKLISQVLINLINNAIEVRQDNKADKHHIEISAGKNIHNRPCISVRNSGPTIPEEILDKVFVPFFTTKENGSGIGLSLSRQIMQKHGGNIEISSSDAAGTEMMLEF